MMNDISKSHGLRQRGNDYYKSVTLGLSPVLQRSRLEQAKKCYTEALECSATAEEAAAANKNLAMTSWKLASLGQDQKDKRSTVMFFYKEALKYFSKALECGRNAQNGYLWSDSLVQNMHQNLQESLDFVNNQPDNMSDEKADLMSMACQHLPAGEYKAEISALYVKHLLGKAIDLLQKGIFKKCKSILHDCHQPLEEARRYCENNRVLLSEVAVLTEDVTMQTAVADARLALETGDNLKIKILMTEEDLNIDMVWEVLDWYKKAILLTREMDVELEAIAMSRIGVIYDRILKLKFRARPYFKGAITLAHSLHPRVLTQEEWYIICTQTLESYQIETAAEEERTRAKERAETLKKLQPQIDKFKDIYDDCACMKYIYNNHPPKNGQTLPIDVPNPSQTQVKKYLLKAILHYHPDSNSIKKFGKEWHVLCEEITKVLTAKYNQIKLSVK